MSPPSLFFNITAAECKYGELLNCVHAVRSNTDRTNAFVRDFGDFQRLPDATFSYWLPDGLLQSFREHPALGQHSGVLIELGASTKNDSRFLRTSWEVKVESSSKADGAGNVVRWFHFAKGGAYSRFYADIYLFVNWHRGGQEIEAELVRKYPYLKGDAEWVLHRRNNYLSPGLTWTARTTSGLSIRILPRGCLFSHKGPGLTRLDDSGQLLLATLALTHSRVFLKLVEAQVAAADGAARSYEIGVLRNTPVPAEMSEHGNRAASLALRGWALQRELDTVTQTSHAFVLPALLQVAGDGLGERVSAWARRVAGIEAELGEVQSEIDDLAFELYGLDREDREALLEGATGSDDDSSAEEEEETDEVHADAHSLASALVSWLMGAAFGRFDVRLATGEVQAPDAPGPFDPLPVCAPGILVDADGLPATADHIASRSFLSSRPDAATYPAKSEHDAPEVESEQYPVRVAWDGILVEDPGLPGDSPPDADLIRRIRDVMTVIWGERARDIEEELAGMLGVSDLRDYVDRHTQFFQDDLRRYSRTRRAPIYWPLSTDSGRYTIWLYYPRLSEDTLYRVVSEHVEPKLASVRQRLRQVTSRLEKSSGREAAVLSSRREELETLERELEGFQAELLRVAELPYRPNLDDGVEINAAPLWKLVPHRQWQTRLKKTWKALEEGDYDWAHLALVLWPDRVKEACRSDQSIAIAHDLEELYEEKG